MLVKVRKTMKNKGKAHGRHGGAKHKPRVRINIALLQYVTLKLDRRSNKCTY